MKPEYPFSLVAGIQDKIKVFAASDTLQLINNQISEAKRSIKLQESLETLSEGLTTLEEEETARRKKIGALLDLTTAKVKSSLSVAGNILPASDSAYDLGADGTEWKNLYVDNIDFGTNSIGNGKFIGGNWTFDGKELSSIGKLTVEDIQLDDSTISANNDDGLNIYDNDSNGIQISDGGNVTFTDNIAVSGKVASNLLPSSDDTYDLGSSSFEWQDIYIDGTAYIDTLSVSGSTTTIGGGTFGNIQVGVTGDNEIDTSSGNLTPDSVGGTVTIDDAATVSGATTLSITLAVTGSITLTGALTANGQFTLGDNEDTGAINTSDWDISTTGDLTGIGSITTDGNFTVADDSWIGIGAANERIVFDSGNDVSFPTGNVGIGLSSPTSRLHVRGGDLRVDDSSNDAILFVQQSTGNVGLGTTGPSDELHVAGQVYTTTGLHIGADSTNNLFDDASNGSGSTTMYIGNASIDVTASDIRLKENVSDSQISGLDILNSLPVRDFDWKEGTKWAGRGRATGLIAQELINILPQVVDKPDDPDNIWSVEYNHLVAYLIKAVQELDSKLDQQKSSPYLDPDPVDLASITADLSSLDAQIASISAQLANIQIASSSAQMQLDLDEKENATISGELNVLGTSTLSETAITGDLTIGLLQIQGLTDQAEKAGPSTSGKGAAFSQGASIQTLNKPLKLQKDALGPLQIMAGKVLIDKEGNITTEGTLKARELEAEGITLKDKVTDSYYCLTIKQGELEKTEGKCSQVNN